MSNKLDDELADAIQAGEPARPNAAPTTKPADQGGLVRPIVDAAPHPKRSLGLLVTLLVMVGAIVALFMVVFQPAAVYATPVDKLVNEGTALIGRKVRVEGELVPGTLVKRDDPCEYRFVIHKGAAMLPVTYSRCTIPDGFRDVPTGGTQVTVEGALAAARAPAGEAPGAGAVEFQATLVMAKCSSKYDPAEHKMKDGESGPLPVN